MGGVHETEGKRIAYGVLDGLWGKEDLVQAPTDGMWKGAMDSTHSPSSYGSNNGHGQMHSFTNQNHNLEEGSVADSRVNDFINIDTEYASDEEEEECRDGRKDRSIKCSLDRMLDVLESLLSFHAFCRYSLQTGVCDITEFNTGVRRLLRRIKAYVDRGDGTLGWLIAKFHEILHFSYDILLFGSPMNYDTGQGERGLKDWAKRPAITAQKRNQEEFIAQVASRTHDVSMLQKATRLLHNWSPPREGH